MSRFPEHGKKIGSLASLESVLKNWRKLNDQIAREWLGKDKDVPWWYNERASLSLFAGAVWLCHGWAFEEFSIWRKVASKRGVKYISGRRDMDFKVGDEWFSVEAKQCWPILGGNAENAVIVVKDCLKQAIGEAKQLKQKGCQRLGIAFAVPECTFPEKIKWTNTCRIL